MNNHGENIKILILSMIKNVIFDWTGVINNNLQASTFSINYILKHFGGRELSWEEIRDNWIQPYPLFYEKIVPGIPLAEEQELYKLAYPVATKKFPPRAFPGMVELLKELKKAKVKVIVISSDHPEHLFQEVEDYGLNGIFDEVYTNVVDKKEGLKGIMTKHNFQPDNTIFIGDSHHEIDTGKSVGMMTGAVTWGFQNEEDLIAANPNYIIRNVEELKKAILK